MILRQSSLLVAALCACAAAPLSSQTTAPGSKTALLIGIDSYSHPVSEIKRPNGATPAVGRFTPGIVYPDLKGPLNDVQSIRELLVSPKFGFPNDAAHIHTLLEKAATRQGILDALELYLVTQPNRGDTVVLYISSHGSLRPYPQGEGDPNGPIFYLSGPDQPPVHVDNTIVPYDWYLGADDIFSRDLRHIFNQAADKGVNLTAIFDSCHSGSIARGAAKPKLVARAFDFDPRPMPPDPYPAGEKAPQSRKDNPVLVLSAALEDQLAIDDQASTPAHGLFTSSLIETLATLPADRPANDVFHRLQAAMELNPDAINQQPVMDASAERRSQPVFGGRAGTGPATAAVLSADWGGVLLDIGTAQGIGVNSEFATLAGPYIVLRVTQSVGFTRSLATVLSPAGASVQPKDIVVLSKLAPANRTSLLFYAGSATLTGDQIQSALGAVRAASLTLVADPTRNPWTHHLAWDGQNWNLTEHSKLINDILRKGEVVRLGATLIPTSLHKIPAGALVWFDAPLSAESLNKLKTTLPADGLAQLTADRSKAMYTAASAAGPNGIGYAWFKIKDLDAEVQTPSGIGVGCSPGSAYPLRTNYVGNAQPESQLNASALALAKLFGWYHLQEASSNNQSPFPYQLALRRVPKTGDVTDGGATWKGSYALDLVATDLSLVSAPPPGFTPRWVYVLAVNCQGEGVVLWPFQGAPPAKFPSIPTNSDAMAQPQPLPTRIQLPGAPFEIAPPFGTDTYLLLTTTTPLTDYNALNFDSVVSRGGSGNALDDLLSATSRGSRGGGTPAPTDWSIKVLQTQSIPEPLPTTPAAVAAEIEHLRAEVANPPAPVASRGGQGDEDKDLNDQLGKAKLRLARLEQEKARLAAKPAENPSGLLTGRYYAILVGVDNDGPDHQLTTPSADAKALARVLHDSYGFETKLLLNQDATRDAILKWLDVYSENLNAEDNLLLYFAGGGGKANRISPTEITEHLRTQTANHVLVVTDTSYSAATAPFSAVAASESPQLLNQMLSKISRTLLAGAAATLATSGAGNLAVIDRLIEALQHAQPSAFSAGLLLTSTEGAKAAPYAGLPDAGHEGGDFVFLKQSPPPPE